MQKLLAIIFGLVLLNLVREYIWVKPPDIKDISVGPSCNLEINIKRKDWSYYGNVFNKKVERIKPISVSPPLVLRGTIISNPHKSYAIIEDMATGVQDLYGLGDIVSGAKIVAMNRNKVVLDYNGTKQELDMAEAGPRPCLIPGHGQGPASAIGVDFTKLLAQMRIKPYFSGGRCIGFQLSNINNDFIKQMGLQDGDIVESINGVQVDDPLKALQIIYSIERNNPVHLGIERRDERMELDCKVEG